MSNNQLLTEEKPKNKLDLKENRKTGHGIRYKTNERLIAKRQKVSLSWENVRYSVKVATNDRILRCLQNRKVKQILHGVTGNALQNKLNSFF